MTTTTNHNNVQRNKELVRRVIERVWNTGDFNSIKDLVADDFVIHLSGSGEDIRGPENIKRFYSEIYKAFPDIHFKIIDQIAEDNKVVTRWSATGTHKGDFKGIPATGNKINFTATDIDEILDGKFVECWSNTDDLTLMQQLGVVPEQG